MGESAPAGPASAVQGFVGKVMSTVMAPVDALNLGLAKATLGLLEILPKMPAARLYTDLVFQFGHSHPHPPSFGIPIPSLGPVLASGCMSVLINGLPSARLGDMGLSVWCGGYFPIFEIMTGSSHVFIGGARAARQIMDPTMHCLPDPFGGKWGIGKLDIAMAAFGLGMSALNVAASMEGEAAAEQKASDHQGEADAAAMAASATAAGVATATSAAQLAADAAAIAMGLLMGKDPGIGFPFGIITMGSPNVLIGGFPMPGWDKILKGMLKLLKPVLRKIQKKLPPGRLRQSMCAATGHPVEVASGRMFTSRVDFEIEGHIPIVFERIYDTSAVDYESALGWGWTHPYDQHLWESKRYNCLIWRDRENRQVRFDKLAVGEKYFQPLERVWLERTGEFEYVLTDRSDGLKYHFGRLSETDEDFTSEKHPLRLFAIEDRNGNRIELSYSGDHLSGVANNSGTSVSFHYHQFSGRTRLAEVRQLLKNGQDINLMRFGYDEIAQLVSATDRTYVPFTYLYENHLMTRETNRNGLSFHFEYDGEGTNARCIHTWGDGNIYERWITYSPVAHITKVRDGLGGETFYHYNDLDLVTKVFDPLGGICQFDYGENGELLSETNQMGRQRNFSYDDQVNCIRLVQEDGSSIGLVYDEYCQPLIIKDETGGEWRTEYDENGNIVATINPLGARREYEYDRAGDATVFRDALGNTTKLEWTASGQIKSIELPRGGRTSYSYNERDLLSEVKDEFTGLKENYQYDDAGRVTRLTETNPNNQTFAFERYEYDDQGNLTLYIDPLGNKTTYKYSGYDKLSVRVDARGYKREFKYDPEERLKEIINENNENYLFEYDLLGRILQEAGFDRAGRIYKYNQAGEVVYEKDALQRETFYRLDKMGRVTSRLRSDKSTVEYEYDECGRVVTARNSHGEVRIAYDPAWNVLKEEQNGQIVSYEYDAENRKILRRLGTGEIDFGRIEYDYDADGNLSLIRFNGREIVQQSDRSGRLIGRQMPNSLREQFDYDVNGRLSREKISLETRGREVVERRYDWDALNNIASITDSRRGARRYSYDAVERLNKVERIIAGENARLPEKEPDRPGGKNILPADKRLWQADDSAGANFGQAREIEDFQYDGDGNLLERKSSVRGQRKFSYDRGDKLRQQEKIQYIYDAVGNLIQKRQGDGRWTSYEYDADNQLISVSTETGGKIEFRYDAFRRRTAKITDQGETGFLWDGDVLLGESKDSQLVTEYVHDNFVPLAKIKNSGIEMYHTDYLGTPREITNEQGEIVWQATYDEFGRVTDVRSQTAQNIRFQGQYEDEETGLYYNRNRYYDADGCRYINQDPIGLFGNYNLYNYCQSPTTGVDPLGLFSWGRYLSQTLGVKKPAGMHRPHAHHIVFKVGAPSQQADLNISRAILNRYNIDPWYGRENLVWAPNENHSDAAARNVRRALERAHRTPGTKAQKKRAVIRALRRLGKKICKRNDLLNIMYL